MLSNKQRKQLKALSHPLKPLCQIGKEGLSDAFGKELLAQLEMHELIKVRILNNCLWDKKDIERGLEDLGITVVQKVGHVLTVYKTSTEHQRISLVD
jgi:RNA-binding protein